MKHTKGKLEVDGMFIQDEEGWCIADLTGSSKDDEEVEDNARRLVACWNALEGVPTEWLEKYVERGIKNVIQDHTDLIRKEEDLTQKLIAAEEENAALREALKPFAAYAAHYPLKRTFGNRPNTGEWHNVESGGITTREEAERIAETAEVAAALRYLVDSHRENAAVDLVHAVMNAVSPDHIVDANKKVEPIAWVNSSDLITAEIDRERYKGGYSDGYVWHGSEGSRFDTPLYTHPAPPSELVKAVDNLLKVFDETDPEVTWFLLDAINTLRTLRKEKP